MTTDTVISKVWSFCHTLRDDGVGYGDYLEQLTFLLFLKMADEFGKPPHNRDVGVPVAYSWAQLRSKKGAELEVQYVDTLRELGTAQGMLGQIFTKAQNKIQDPAKLSRVIDMVDSYQWVSLDADTKGDIYEGILEKNAEDTKSGAGQYFTPRALIQAMVACVQPEPNKTIADPACGTGGFFLAAYEHLVKHHKLDRAQKEFLKNKTFHGNEIVPGMRFDDLKEFIDCYQPGKRHKRKATWDVEKNPEGRWRSYSYEELIARDKTSLDLFWLKDKSLADLDNLPEPEILAEEIIDNIEAGLNSFRVVAAALGK